MSTDKFPKTVFVKNLPEDAALGEIAELFDPYGNILELSRMEDNEFGKNVVLVRFSTGEGAKKCVDAAADKNKNKIKFRGQNIYVIPKRNRNKSHNE